MHVPDGFLDGPTALGCAALAVTGLAVALPRVERQLPPRRVPLLGLAGAFVFAAQMLNFPVGGGTSGHLVGSVLVTALLGPAAAVVVLTAVLLVQCFLFADGGLTALGANVLNMAIVAPLAGLPGLWLGRRLRGARGLVAGAMLGGWLGVVVAAAACAVELALSGAAAFSVAFPAMVAVHAVIGIGEGLVTALVLLALARVRPDLVDANAPAPALPRWWPLPVAIAAALLLSPFASELPDGLERVAERLGLVAPAAAAATTATAPLADYQAPGIASPVLATLLAGAAGACVVYLLGRWLARTLVPARPES